MAVSQIILFIIIAVEAITIIALGSKLKKYKKLIQKSGNYKDMSVKIRKEIRAVHQKNARLFKALDSFIVDTINYNIASRINKENSQVQAKQD